MMVDDALSPRLVPDVVPGPEWDGHVLLLHACEDERLTGLTSWVSRGLNQGEKIFYAEDAVAPDDSVVAALRRRGVDLDRAVSDGRFTLMPVAGSSPAESPESVVRRALSEGFRAVRVSGEASAARTIHSAEDHARQEWIMEELCRTLPVSALCQYPLPLIEGALLDEVVSEHSTGVREGAFSTYRDGSGLALGGEIDLTNGDVFAATVRAAFRTEEAVVWLDFSRVRFIDVAACRTLARASKGFRNAGGQLRVVRPGRSMRWILRLLEIDRLPGFEVIGDET